MAAAYRDAYRHYCWNVTGVDDLAVAPFQILAAEGHVHALEPHAWHLARLDRLVAAGPGVLRRTERIEVDLDDPASVTAGVEWWTSLTSAGGEGMVVKPSATIASGERGVTQPGIKCRGPEYLRIIYGPEYSTDRNLDRLRQRGLGHKRALAAREFALGIEALERFVADEPLHRVHECVFGVLALESEPVDPTL
jgi:protein phosphatase